MGETDSADGTSKSATTSRPEASLSSGTQSLGTQSLGTQAQTSSNSQSSQLSTSDQVSVERAGAESLKGVVKWFNDAKGYGFIEHTSGKDVFVHYSSIISEGFKSLKDGEPVEYEMVQGEKGLHAVRVVRMVKDESPTEGQSAPSGVSEQASTTLESKDGSEGARH